MFIFNQVYYEAKLDRDPDMDTALLPATGLASLNAISSRESELSKSVGIYMSVSIHKDFFAPYLIYRRWCVSDLRPAPCLQFISPLSQDTQAGRWQPVELNEY